MKVKDTQGISLGVVEGERQIQGVSLGDDEGARHTERREGEGEKEIKTDDAHYAPTYLPTYLPSDNITEKCHGLFQ